MKSLRKMKVYRLKHKTGKFLHKTEGGWNLNEIGTIFTRKPTEKRYNTYSFAKYYPFSDFKLLTYILTEFLGDEEENNSPPQQRA